MSKITNDGLTRSGKGRITVATVGFKGLNNTTVDKGDTDQLLLGNGNVTNAAPNRRQCVKAGRRFPAVDLQLVLTATVKAQTVRMKRHRPTSIAQNYYDVRHVHRNHLNEMNATDYNDDLTYITS